MFKAIKIRLYPNKEQTSYINRLTGSCRKVYNMCLEKKISAYNINKENFGLSELSKYFRGDLMKSEEFEYLNEHNTKVLAQTTIDLLNSYNRFFVNHTGFPKFKSKHSSNQSCRFPVDAISKRNIYSDSRISLTTALQKIKFKCSKRDKEYLVTYKDKIRSATLTKTKTDKYFLSILIENFIKPLPEPINDVIGIDIGIKTFIVSSDGQVFNNLKLIHKNEKKLKKLQKQLSKKKRIKTGEKIFSKKYNKDVEVTKLSNNGEKAKIKLAKAHEKINNIKLNYIHNITTQLVRENQTIGIEDLNVLGMLKNQNLSKSISELSIGETFRQLKYKCEWYERNLVQIDRWFPSSKKCSHCGYIYKGLTLNEREWICPECREKHNRDFNASTNIEDETRRILGIRCPKFTLVDYPTMDDIGNINVTALKSSGRMKQEEKTKLIV